MRVLSLNYTTAPSRLLPHGLLGVVALGIGILLVSQTAKGSFEAFGNIWLMLSFVLVMLGNSIAGYMIAHRAPKRYQVVFRHAAGFQCCLCYYCWRFSPACSRANVPHPWLLDATMALLTLSGIASFGITAARQVPAVVGCAICIGCVALGLLAAYPLQLAHGGEDWWQCVQARYSMQAAGMVGCIYVPAATAFAAMLFGSTLWVRNIISDVGFGGGFLACVLATLVGTVLLQEYHIPVVSTQKIYLPCPAPAAGTLGARIENLLDFSAIASDALVRLGAVSRPSQAARP